MDFSTIRGSDGYFCSVSTGKALHQYTFKIKVLRNHPAICPHWIAQQGWMVVATLDGARILGDWGNFR